eukprot:3656595-Heterocapsa_arctica.AAC.1
MASAPWAQQAAAALTRASGDDDLDKEVMRGTLEEVEKGWIRGPYSTEQVAEVVGNLWIPSRRFGLKQGAKVRLIDDMSEHG